MTETPRFDQTTDDEALGPDEAAERDNPDVGEGTPLTAPARPVDESLVERVRRTMRRNR